MGLDPTLQPTGEDEILDDALRYQARTEHEMDMLVRDTIISNQREFDYDLPKLEADTQQYAFDKKETITIEEMELIALISMLHRACVNLKYNDTQSLNDLLLVERLVAENNLCRFMGEKREKLTKKHKKLWDMTYSFAYVFCGFM